MLLTRNIINKNIIFKDVNVHNLWQKDKQFNFEQLNNLINIVKNILQKDYNCQTGQTVLIGITTSALQVATFFACAELGLEIVIADHARNDNWIDPNYVDPKTKSLLPIDYFIVTSDQHQIPKYKLFYKICNETVQLSELNTKDNTPNMHIGCNPNSIILKCTSSGTTGTAKIVKHSHEFLYKLIQRNKQFFYGKICMGHNLNHGSSPATYFLPALCSERTELFVSFMFTYITDLYKSTDEIYKLACHKFKSYTFDHFMIPYSHLIDDFLNTGNNSSLTIYTLSTIKSNWLSYYKSKQIKDIVSFFGSNETSGPTFINRISEIDFQESKYKTVDNFYTINLLNDKELEVTMPVYNTKICTNDTFRLENECYFHCGRNDLYRVNGQIIDLELYNSFVSANATLIVDSKKDNLYLAFWEECNFEEKIKEINLKLHDASYNVHKINKFAVLDKNKFLSGVKLDMELLRDYFRNFI
jgi:hypothetical protein